MHTLSSRPWPTRIGIALPVIALGAVVLFMPLLPWAWGLLPGVGSVLAAFAVGVGLVLHGLFSVLRVFRGDSDERFASLLAAIASLVVGAVAFSWPVLTLVIFQLAVGAWLVFIGLRLVAAALIQSARRRRELTAKPKRRWLPTVG